MVKMRMLAPLAVLLILAACGGGSGGKYGEVKDALNEQMDVMEEFVTAANKPDNAQGIVQAMENLEKIGSAGKAKMEKMAEKYPEIADQENPPEELKPEMERMEKMVPEFMGAMMKVMQEYGDNPDIQAAMQKMQKSGGGMQPSSRPENKE